MSACKSTELSTKIVAKTAGALDLRSSRGDATFEAMQLDEADVLRYSILLSYGNKIQK